MWIRTVTIMAGPDGVTQPGTVLELATPQAQRLIQAGAAVAVDAPGAGGDARVVPAAPAEETAAVRPPETPEARRVNPPKSPPKRKG